MASELPFEAVDDIGFVQVEDIDMGDRLRPVDPIHVEVLGRAMMREGQTTPIVICRLPGAVRWTLVAGAHRLEAARKFGMPMLKAEIIGAGKIERRQHEVSENLWRKSLDPIDRANFIAELVRLAKLRAGIHPDASAQQVAINARWQKIAKEQAIDTSDTMSHVYGWSDEVAELVGLSKRSVERDIILHTRLVPSELERLRKVRHPVATNATQLRALAKLEPVNQSRVVSLLLYADAKLGQPAKTVGEAWSRINEKAKAPADAETKRLSSFIGTFSRMGLAEKKGALEQLGHVLPAGNRIIGPNDDFTPAAEHMATIAKGLDAAFAILIALGDGEPVEDEQINDALGDVQTALMTANHLKKGFAA